MQLSRKALDVYNAAIKQQGGNAENAARQVLEAWFEENPGATVEQTRDFCIALMQSVGTLYGNAAGDAAYALRDVIADAAGIELPDVDYTYEPDREFVDATARYQAGKLVAGDVDGFKHAICDASRYFAERGANDTMAALGKADAKALGKRVRFARIPTGATTCPYCLMLASRGFVYRSELRALNANHRHCDCRIVEGFDGMTVEGYDPDKYYDMWKHPEKYQNTSQNSSTQQPKYTFSQFKTKKDAVSYLRDEFGFEKVSTGLTVDELNEIARSFTAYFNKFPFMVGVVKEIKTGKMKAAAYYSSNETRTKTGQKTFNPVFKFDRASIRSASSDCVYCCDPSNFASGYRWWSTKSGIDGIVMHEGVHAIEYKVLMKRAGFSEGDVISPVDAFKFRMRRGEVSKEVVEEAFKRCNIPYTDENVCKYISEYGSKNTLETLAEALSCEDNSNKVCSTIKDVFDELLQKEGFL